MALLGQVTAREGAETPVAEELIATKLAPPSVRPGYVPRQRLIDALAAGSDLRLTLVDAPRGTARRCSSQPGAPRSRPGGNG